MRRILPALLRLALAVPLLAQTSELVYRDAQGRQRRIRSPRDWEKRRRQILANLQLVMGSLPQDRHDPPEMTVVAEERLPGYLRRKITYVPEAGDRVPAWLLIPLDAAPGRKLPAMLCLHQTTRIGKGEPAGLGGLPNLHYAAELAERGYVTLAPDYPNFGDYSFDPYTHGYASATMKGIFNHMRAVDLLASLPEVDPARIGAIGHSLGGHNTLFLGVFDTRVRVLVSSCGFNSFAKYKGGDLTGWSHRGYMPRIASEYGKSAARMPFDFTDILAALAPRPVFVNAPEGDTNFEVSGVRDCLDAARPVYDLFHASGRLVAEHPQAGHDFPQAVRTRAYQFVDQWLKPK